MKNTQNRVYVMYGLAVVVVAVVGYFGYMQYKKMQNTPEAIAKAQLDEKDSLVKKLGILMLLPAESPVMVKIDNAEQLTSQQQFFKGSINGDVVFIFPQAARAIIYSPSRNMIVNSGPVQSAQPQQQAPTATPKVEEKAPAKTDTKTTTTPVKPAVKK